MPARSDRPSFLDMAPLMVRLEGWLAGRAATVRQVPAGGLDGAGLAAFAAQVGYAPAGRARPEVIVGGQVALELGHPRTAAASFVLLTGQAGPVADGRIRWVGPDLSALPRGARRPFAQIVLLATEPRAQPDPFAMEALQFLTHRLDGYMARSVPGRLWVRISQAAHARGLGFETVGRALLASYRRELPEIEAAEVLFVVSSDADVSALEPLATEARIMAGRHRKLTLGADGELECAELDCDGCDDRPVCDSLRDVTVQRRRRRRSGEAARP